MTSGVLDRVDNQAPPRRERTSRAPRRRPQRRPERRPAPPLSARAALASTALTVVTILLLSFVFEVAAMGAVRHARAQRVGYDDLRVDLANGVAPIGQQDADGELVVPGRAVALMTIPAIGLREVVFDGTSGSVLTQGPGHSRDTVMPGQAGTSLIFGRQAGYGGPFGRISDLRKGDEIAVTTGQGSHLYLVTQVRHAGDTMLAPEAGTGRLTLVSASGTPFLPDEVVRVDATLKSPVQPAPPTVFGSSSLPDSEGVMRGDRNVALPMFLWAQLMLLVALALAWAGSAWGRWQSWVVGLPVLAVPCLQLAHQIAQLLPNLL